MKSSIIAVETTEQEVDEEDFIQDSTEVTDFVNAHRGPEVPSAATEPHGNRLLASDCLNPFAQRVCSGHVACCAVFQASRPSVTLCFDLPMCCSGADMMDVDEPSASGTATRSQEASNVL